MQVSFERARDTGRRTGCRCRSTTSPTATAVSAERYWSLTSVPVLDEEGQAVLVVQRAEDVTDYVLGRVGKDPVGDAALDGARGVGVDVDRDRWRRRSEELESDLFARAQDLAAAMEAKELSARRLGHLAALALQLSGAESVDDLAAVLTRERVSVLGAHAAAVLLPDPEGGWRVPLSTATDPSVTAPWQHIDADSPMPAPTVARTGHRLLLLTREATQARHPEMLAVNEATGMAAWAFLPLRSRAELLGSLVLSWRDEQDLSADDLELLEGFAAQLSQTLARIRATAAEAAASAEVHRLSETVQRSLLQNPPVPDGLQVAVRYVPAAEHVRVGGDWYDAFVTTAGSTLLTIGDVTGHDGTAAATMAQIRSLLRGLAYDSEDTPATVLTRLDRALEGLRLDTLATAVLVRVEDATEGVAEGGDRRRWRLRWANAGHLSPVLRHADGRVVELEVEHDLLLGLDPTTDRRDRVVDLEPGSTLVLHTDGLIERRTVSLQTGIDLVARSLATHGERTVEDLADRLLADVAPEHNEDDIALLVLRVG